MAAVPLPADGTLGYVSLATLFRVFWGKMEEGRLWRLKKSIEELFTRDNGIKNFRFGWLLLSSTFNFLQLDRSQELSSNGVPRVN